jgi:hypothetical protein
MKLILLFLLVVSCKMSEKKELSQPTKHIEFYVDTSGSIVKADTFAYCSGSLGLSNPPTLLGEHQPDCWHRKQANTLPSKWTDGNIKYSETKPPAKIKKPCKHIWVSEYVGFRHRTSAETPVVCIKCHKKETRLEGFELHLSELTDSAEVYQIYWDPLTNKFSHLSPYLLAVDSAGNIVEVDCETDCYLQEMVEWGGNMVFDTVLPKFPILPYDIKSN